MYTYPGTILSVTLGSWTPPKIWAKVIHPQKPTAHRAINPVLLSSGPALSPPRPFLPPKTQNPEKSHLKGEGTLGEQLSKHNGDWGSVNFK